MTGPFRPARRRPRLTHVLLAVLSVGGLLLLGSVACLRRAPPLAAVAGPGQTSASCRECHADIFQAWSDTDHALANRPVDPARDRDAFAIHPHAAAGGTAFALAWSDGGPRLTEMRPGEPRVTHTPSFILGARPLWQPLIPAPGGRWQPTDLAFDVQRREWFNVFGDEHRRPGEWGHWTGRGMNWNSMCAPCHMTGYRKNYDPAADRYTSTWVEHGIGCIQCHGPMPSGHDAPRTPRSPPPAQPFRGDRQRIAHVCASCHARHEQLTERFQPGDDYADHFRVTLPVDAATFYPDGQQRDEDFNWTSVLLSRMGHAGVTCLDCHDPHTTRTILPVADNQLCLQCHALPGRLLPGGVRAVPIDPLAHSRHQPDSAGNSCIACHMPAKNYMQRAPRHDHGWLSPDPLLTRELGIPNACSTCHADRGIDWTVAKADEWFGTRVRERQRRRARAVDAAQSDAPGAAARLLEAWRGEDIPAWRATFLSLLPRTGDAVLGREVAEASLRAADPIERAAAARYFFGAPDVAERLGPLLADPIRSARLEAAWALSPTLSADSPARRELDDYLALTLDQPAGRVRRAQEWANRGRIAEAAAEMSRAAEWDPFSPGIRQSLGLVLAADGRIAAAAEELGRAVELAPDDAPLALQAALAHAEAGQPEAAERLLRAAVERSPGLHRAWYNLGLLLAQRGCLAEAAEALRRAEQAQPRAADYPHALSTVLQRLGDREGARAAAARAASLARTR
ncbi:MAG: tetratricopeptide repeat protein [Verrucomicrobiota bacterium]|jgi:predicted CXXCH cytochrome family protein